MNKRNKNDNVILVYLPVLSKKYKNNTKFFFITSSDGMPFDISFYTTKYQYNPGYRPNTTLGKY